MSAGSARTALVDQVEAASRHALSAFTATAAKHADRVTHQVPTGAALAVLTRLYHGLLAGTITLCPHASTRTPQPLFWAAWRPGRVRCAPCAQRAALAIKGTVEDKRCDHCHRVSSTTVSVACQLPAIIWPHELRALGPIGAMFGVCRRCRAAR
jgi:hypothetical protein